MSIATKTGDNGTTALMYGRRVAKWDPRVAVSGAVDELNAALGLARAVAEKPLVAEPIFTIQKELIILMGEFAVAEEDLARYHSDGFKAVTPGMVDRLTSLVDDLEQNHQLSFKGWATPGNTLAAAALDLARTVCRRAERQVVELADSGTKINAHALRYLNRLSDLLWLYARWSENRTIDPLTARGNIPTCNSA